MAKGRCASKVRHPSAGAAKHVLRRMKQRGKVIGHLRPYPCPQCGGWHLGTEPDGGLSRAARTIAKIDAAIATDKAKREAAQQKLDAPDQIIVNRVQL